MRKKGLVNFKYVAIFLIIVFSLSLLFSDLIRIKESSASGLGLPEPTQLLSLSGQYSPAVLKGLRVDSNDPMKFEFIVSGGDNVDEQEVSRLINYFLATLTVPHESLWVNLSPYESDRIIDENLGLTDLGKDMLSQDYILKQLMSSVTHPETNIGEDFWKNTYSKLLAEEGSTNFPVDTFNKIWIVPNETEVHEENGLVLISKASLKALMEEDYLAIAKAKEEGVKDLSKLSSTVMKQTILPRINEEVNNGKHFATLRQMYHSMILAMWFKSKFENSFYASYMDKNKIDGIDIEDKTSKQKIYNLYVDAFKKGVYDFVKKEYDPGTKKKIKRHYFSGGLAMSASSLVPEEKKGIPEELLSEISNTKEATIIRMSLLPKAGEELLPVGKAASAINVAQAENDVLSKFAEMLTDSYSDFEVKDKVMNAAAEFLDGSMSFKEFWENALENVPVLASERTPDQVYDLFFDTLDIQFFPILENHPDLYALDTLRKGLWNMIIEAQDLESLGDNKVSEIQLQLLYKEEYEDIVLKVYRTFFSEDALKVKVQKFKFLEERLEAFIEDFEYVEENTNFDKLLGEDWAKEQLKAADAAMLVTKITTELNKKYGRGSIQIEDDVSLEELKEFINKRSFYTNSYSYYSGSGYSLDEWETDKKKWLGQIETQESSSAVIESIAKNIVKALNVKDSFVFYELNEQFLKYFRLEINAVELYKQTSELDESLSLTLGEFVLFVLAEIQKTGVFEEVGDYFPDIVLEYDRLLEIVFFLDEKDMSKNVVSLFYRKLCELSREFVLFAGKIKIPGGWGDKDLSRIIDKIQYLKDEIKDRASLEELEIMSMIEEFKNEDNDFAGSAISSERIDEVLLSTQNEMDINLGDFQKQMLSAFMKVYLKAKTEKSMGEITKNTEEILVNLGIKEDKSKHIVEFASKEIVSKYLHVVADEVANNLSIAMTKDQRNRLAELGIKLRKNKLSSHKDFLVEDANNDLVDLGLAPSKAKAVIDKFIEKNKVVSSAIIKGGKVEKFIRSNTETPYQEFILKKYSKQFFGLGPKDASVLKRQTTWKLSQAGLESPDFLLQDLDKLIMGEAIFASSAIGIEEFSYDILTSIDESVDLTMTETIKLQEFLLGYLRWEDLASGIKDINKRKKIENAYLKALENWLYKNSDTEIGKSFENAEKLENFRKYYGKKVADSIEFSSQELFVLLAYDQGKIEFEVAKFVLVHQGRDEWKAIDILDKYDLFKDADKVGSSSMEKVVDGNVGGIDLKSIDVKADASSAIMNFAPFDVLKLTGFSFEIISFKQLTKDSLLAMLD